MGSYSPLLPLIYCILLLMSVNYPSHFTEPFSGIIPPAARSHKGGFVLLVSVLSLIFCGVKNEDNTQIHTRQWEPGPGQPGCVKEWVLQQEDPASSEDGNPPKNVQPCKVWLKFSLRVFSGFSPKTHPAPQRNGPDKSHL